MRPTDSILAKPSMQSSPSFQRVRRVGKAMAVLLTGIAIAWIVWKLVEIWPSILKNRSQIDYSLLALGTILLAFAALLTCGAFALILWAGASSSMRFRELAHLYFVGQMLKHLPGRVWGIGYQWAAGGGRHTVGKWLEANLIHIGLSIYFVLWIAGLVLASVRNLVVGFAVFAAGIFVYSMLSLCINGIRWFAWPRLFPTRVQLFAARFLDGLVSTLTAERWRIFVLFSAVSLVTYTAWYVFGSAYGPIGGTGGIRMCALYLLAWFAGYVSFLTPSGLGVREVAFAWLAKDFPPDAIALMAIVGRVSMLTVDVGLGAAFAAFFPRDLPPRSA